ncbi:MAG: transporter [Microscillaceae bacterium]|nr:transporter [Microscillaceae bacterium]
MKKIVKQIFCLSVCIYSVFNLSAQTPSDALMMQKGEFCFGLNYEYGSWDQYWEGTDLRSNETIATLRRQAFMPGVSIGILNRVNLILSVPHIKTSSSEPNGGKFQGAKGFQDLSIVLKTQLFHREIGKGDLSLLTALGFSTPISRYLSDYMPYSLGLGANQWTFRGIAQYRLHSGLYAHAALAYLWRGLTEAERDYYYNNGSYYTAFMDVPNAWNYHGSVGIWLFDNSLKVEANYMGLKSLSGDDIRAYNAPQPTNKIQFDQVGFFSQYYFKKSLKGLGVLAYYNQIIQGRNMGKFSTFGLGLTYQFKLQFKSKSNTQED